jgi:DAK2 domain fusion protein YloV
VTTDRLSGESLRQLVLAAAAELERNKEAVNALNVFPVPDGDTGTNMSLTVQAALREMQKCREDTAAAIGKAVSLGSLMGARGNSGVILSQLFRGIGRGMEGQTDLSPTDLARALQLGVETAYKAVMRPVEGTILTVAREMAKSAQRAARDGGSIRDVLRAARAGAEAALARTPDLLPVLRQAGVVDAGGRGLVVLLAGMVNYLDVGQVRPAVEPGPALRAVPPPAVTTPQFQIDEHTGDITYAYDTQLLIRRASLDLDLDLDRVRAQLTSLGDSMLVVGTAELAKVHIHTNNPGTVLEICLQHGSLSDITIDNMREQFEAIRQSRSAGNGGAHGQGPVAAPPAPALEVPLMPVVEMPPKQVGVVTVAIGDGLEKILRSLGADVVINGGQTMNPSTEELVEGILAAPAPEVLLIPNNSNIIMAAQQAIALTSKTVAVVPSRNIPQGVAALLAYNPQAGLDQNTSRMTTAMRGVRTGEITYAVRSTSFNGIDINAGDILGIIEDEIAVTGKEPNEVLGRLLVHLVGDDSEVITILYGADVSEELAEQALDMIGGQYPAVEVEGHRGGQPLFYYLVSVE